MQRPGRSEIVGDTLWVGAPDQIRVGLNPRRQDIVDRLAASGPLSVRELAGTVAAKPSALYHHIAMLIEVGLVKEAGQRLARGKREQLYDTPARQVRLKPLAGGDSDPTIVTEFVGALSRQMDRDFSSGAGSPLKCSQGDHRNLGFRRILGRPDPATLALVNAKLEEVGALLSSSDGAGAVVALTWIMSPLGSVPKDASDPEGD